VLVVWLDRRLRLGHGRAFAVYVMGYTLGRTWIELMRTDDATHVAGVRINVWVSILVFLGGAVYFLLARSRGEREDPASLRGKDAPPLDEPDDEATPEDEDTKAKDSEADEDVDADEDPDAADADEDDADKPVKAYPKAAPKADDSKAKTDVTVDTEAAEADAAKPAAGDADADKKADASAKSES
jgi:hypothetical protein